MYVAKQIKILFFINERAFMLNHYRGTGGYAALYLMIVFGVILLTTVLAVIMSVVGLGQNAGKIAGGIIFIALWAIGFVVMQRFIAIEKRRPTLGESNIVGVKSVLYFLAITLVVVLVIAVTVLLTKLIGGGGGDANQARQAAQTGDSTGQNQQAIGALFGIFATMFFLYMAPFLNMAVLSKLFSPSSKT